MPEQGHELGLIVPGNAWVTCGYVPGVGLHVYFHFGDRTGAMEGAEYLVRQAEIARDQVKRRIGKLDDA